MNVKDKYYVIAETHHPNIVNVYLLHDIFGMELLCTLMMTTLSEWEEDENV